jgi:hypothetical protein
VDAGVKVVFFENLVHGGCIAGVRLDKGNFLPDDFADSAERFVSGINQVVDGDNGMACLVQFNNGVAADITSATNHCNLH